MALPTTPTRLTAANDAWRGDTLQEAWIQGLAGDDKLDGTFTAIARLEGGDGRDHLIGGSGADTLYGGTGDDWLEGGAGNDILRGGDGIDVMFGGDGDDTFYAQWGPSAVGYDAIDGGAGYDTVRFVGVELHAHSLSPASGVERFVLTERSETLDFSTYSSASGPGTAPAGVRVDAMTGDDVLFGTQHADRFYGGEGNDRLYGHAGNDTLSGQGGNDYIVGGAGNDVLVAGAGWDVLNGGADNDRFDLRQMLAGISNLVGIEDFTKGQDKVDLRGLGVTFADLTISQEPGPPGKIITTVLIGSDPATQKWIGLVGLTPADITADMFLT